MLYLFCVAQNGDSLKVSLNPLKGHVYPVFTLTFSHDGNLLASGSTDGDIRIWDTQTGELKKSLTGHTARVMSLVFNHDGKTLFSTSDDGTVILWEINP